MTVQRPLYLAVPQVPGPAFAWYHPAAQPAPLGVVLCAPHGSELMCCYRALRILAETLAKAGIPVMRVDYHGTGDSAGGDEDPDRVAAWLGSIDAAVDALRHQSGVGQVSLVGVRLGALLAAAVTARRDDIASLVLWGACRSGKAYVREQRVLRMAEAKHAGGDTVLDGQGSTEEAAGFALTGQTIAQLGTLDFATLTRTAPKVLCIARDDFGPDNKIVSALGKHGADVTSVEWPGFAKMMLAPHYSIPPESLFAALAGWLTAQPGAAPTVAVAATTDSATWTEPHGDVVHEEVIRFGDGRLVGLVCHPPDLARGTVILANTGANHHVGPNRMYVTMARRWATLGFRVLRMDTSGIGDSDAPIGSIGNRPYTVHGVSDLGAGLAELQRRWPTKRAIVIGLCSGAYVAFNASLEGLPLDAQILVNPQTFYWKEGDTIDVAPGKIYDGVQYYRRSLWKLESWKKALTGRIQYRKIASLLGARARIVADGAVKKIVRRHGRRFGLRTGDDVGADLATITDRGIDTFIVFSAGDPGIDYLVRHAGSELERLQRRPNFNMAYIDGADHTFTALAAQERLFELVTQHLLGPK